MWLAGVLGFVLGALASAGVIVFLAWRHSRERKPEGFAPRHCPSCGVTLPTASPEFMPNMFMVICPRGCGTCNVIAPSERSSKTGPEERCDCPECSAERAVAAAKPN